MRTELRFDRRTLVAVAALGVVAGLGATRWLRDEKRGPTLAFTTNAAGVFPDGGAAAELGEAYLRDHAEEADEARLARLLETADPRWRDFRRRADAALARRLARESARGDYTAGRVVLVEGWYLSRTEARLCALATFV